MILGADLLAARECATNLPIHPMPNTWIDLDADVMMILHFHSVYPNEAS